jgi:hypothetical protein
MASASTCPDTGTQFAAAAQNGGPRRPDEWRMNAPLSNGSARSRQCACNDNETETASARYCRQGDDAMIILMLAAAMTIAMLIATAFGIHEESRRVQQRERIRSARRFGLTN